MEIKSNKSSLYILSRKNQPTFHFVLFALFCINASVQNPGRRGWRGTVVMGSRSRRVTYLYKEMVFMAVEFIIAL
jgi:hypothetical protein